MHLKQQPKKPILVDVNWWGNHNSPDIWDIKGQEPATKANQT